MPRNPKKGGVKPPTKPKAKASKSTSSKAKKGPSMMDMDGAPSNGLAKVWRPGVDPLEEDEELDYDPTAYDCLHRLQLDWPCLSFDLIGDELGGPRSTFPHCITMVAGTQASTAKQNYLAFLKLANLGQGRHGKKANKDPNASESEDEDTDDDDMSDSDAEQEEVDLVYGPPRMHYRMVNHMGGVNRVRTCPQQPTMVAVWADTAQVRIYDGSKLVKEMWEEAEQPAKARNKMDLKPLIQHGHAMEGFALDWSPVRAGRLASGDCKKNLYVWEPAEGGRWQVSGSYTVQDRKPHWLIRTIKQVRVKASSTNDTCTCLDTSADVCPPRVSGVGCYSASGHESSVEDLAWSPMEETVFASCSSDKTLRIWDTRERSKSMISVQAHDTDVNVISWNRLVSYMLASGADDGALRIWDLRSFAQDGPVSEFKFHKGYVTGLEWCPYEGSMLASTASDNQLAVWDLALERDAEEEASLAPAGNALAPEDMPAQLLFLHAGQHDLKECHWHTQVPGLIVSTAGDGFNVFKASNM